MNIGIDIDGVLTDYERFVADYGAKFCTEHNIPYSIKPEHYDEGKVFGWTEEQTEAFWNEYLVYYASNYPTREFASEMIQKLKDKGVAKVEEIDTIDAVVDFRVVLELLGIGILLSIISSLASMISIQRFSPLTILKERS